MSYKVKQEDLKGDIKDFPIEVVQKMVDEQVKQGNKADVSVFQEQKSSLKSDFGFDWFCTRDGHEFWRDVVSIKNFDLFFSKYPKQSDLKEDNSKDDKVVVKEKKTAKRTFKKLSEVKLLVTNRNRKAVVAFLNEVCNESNRRWVNSGISNASFADCYLCFSRDDINSFSTPSINKELTTLKYKETVKLRDIKRIYAREENRKQRELEKTKLFCETIEENVSHSESEVNKIELKPFNSEEIKPIIDELSKLKSVIIGIWKSNNEKSKLDKEVKTNEELRKMLNGNIEVLKKREEQLTSLDIENEELKTVNNKLRDYNDVLENKVYKEKLFRNVFLLMFTISFITLIAISLKY